MLNGEKEKTKKEELKSWNTPEISKFNVKKITLSGSVNGSENGQVYHRT